MNRSISSRAKRDSHRCESGKARYRDKTEAVKALHTIKNNAAWQLEAFGETHRRESRTYKCSICNGWHLTSQPKRGTLLTSNFRLVLA